MSLLNTRKQGTSGIAEKRFIRKVLREQGENILEEQTRRMSAEKLLGKKQGGMGGTGFKKPEWYAARSAKADDSKLVITELQKHRFVDMNYRNTRHGRVKKKKLHPIYNKIIFGHLNNIVRELSYGFTEEVIQEMKKLEE